MRDRLYQCDARALRERVGELLPGRARPVDVALESDAIARAPDGLQHRGENAVAVQQHLETVASHDRRAQQHAHAAQEIRILDSIEPLDPLFNLLLAGGEIQRQDDGGNRHARGDGDDAQPAGCRHRDPPGRPLSFIPRDRAARTKSASVGKRTNSGRIAQPD